MRHVTELSCWEITLFDGSKVQVWADSHEIDGDDVVFGMLVDASSEELSALNVLSVAPSNPERVAIALARFPQSIVATVYTL